MNPREASDAVDAARRMHRVPGVTAAFYADGKVVTAASGETNVSTGVEMTTDAIAHIGSITKLMNATLLMQLVDRGLVDLDARVVEYLPELRSSDHSAADITVEMLLNHTSGLGANLLPDVGHDREVLQTTFERTIAEPPLHAPGAARSYCNAGTVVAGYLCQRISGTGWHDLIKQNVFGPLAMERAVVLPEDALLHRASVGHFLDPKTDTIVRTTHAFLPLGYAPAGATAMTTATDLMTFVLAHLNDGAGSNGTRMLSKESAQRMRALSGNTRMGTFESGIGWRRTGDLIGHGGGGPGIVSYVSAHAASQTAVVVLTNAEHGLGVLQDLISPFMKSNAGVDPLPNLPAAQPNLAFGAQRYTGTYENNTVVHDISFRDGALYWTAAAKHRYYDSSYLEQPPAVRLVPAAKDWFLADASASAMTHAPTALVGFFGDASGRAEFLGEQLWLFRRTA